MRYAPCTRRTGALATLLVLAVMLVFAATSAQAESWGEFPRVTPARTRRVRVNEAPVPPKFAAGPEGTYYVLSEVPEGSEPTTLEKKLEGLERKLEELEEQ